MDISQQEVSIVTIVIAVVATVIVWVFKLLEVEKLPKVAHDTSSFLLFLLTLATLGILFLANFSWISGIYRLLVLTSSLGLFTLLRLWLIGVARWCIGRIRLVLLLLLLFLLSRSPFLLSQLWSLCVLPVFLG